MSNIIEPKILYGRTAKGAINVWSCWAEGDEVCTSYGQLDGKLQLARFRVSPKNTGKANSTTGEQQALKEVASLYDKKRKAKYAVTLDTAGETDRIKPILAGDYEKHKKKLKFPVTVQPKLDGLRMLAYHLDGEIVLQSRGGDFYPVAHIVEALKPVLHEGMTLDGELYIHGVPLQEITSLSKRPQEGSTELTYQIYDVPSHGGPWIERLAWLNDFSEGLDLNGPLNVLGDCQADSHADIDEAHKDAVAEGYEGAIVRTSTGMYREGYRSPDLLKVKQFKDDEYKIVGWETGKGKDEKIPKFICVTKEGKNFGVKCKGSAKVQAEYLAKADELIGQLLKTKYFQLTPDGIPQFPVGLAIRYPEDL